jgi:hypothetical protein
VKYSSLSEQGEGESRVGSEEEGLERSSPPSDPESRGASTPPAVSIRPRLGKRDLRSTA